METLRTSHRIIAVAPMMDWTDRHCRYFMRQLAPSVALYTEMITAAAIRHGDRDKLLAFDPSEHPLAVQLGGSDPALMAAAAAECNARGFDEININVGCPSDRVRSGQFGACLMAEPRVVASCYRAMQDCSDVPVTVKTRLGIDDNDSYEFLTRFIDELKTAGCRKFILHARIAILDGLSPKDNRSVPPLDYERVYRLKRDYPDLVIVLNGGVTDADSIGEVLKHVDGVMIGRQAYHDPYFLAQLEAQHFGATLPSRQDVAVAMLDYIERELGRGERLHRMTRHMLGLFNGRPGARAWRRMLSENAHRPDAGTEVVKRALDALPQA